MRKTTQENTGDDDNLLSNLSSLIASGDLDSFFALASAHLMHRTAKKRELNLLSCRYNELNALRLKNQISNEEWLREFSRISEGCMQLLTSLAVSESEERKKIVKYGNIVIAFSIVALVVFFFPILRKPLVHSSSQTSGEQKNSLDDTLRKTELEQNTKTHAANAITKKNSQEWELRIDYDETLEKSRISAIVEQELTNKGIALALARNEKKEFPIIYCSFKLDSVPTTLGVRDDAIQVSLDFTISIRNSKGRVCYADTFLSESRIIYSGESVLMLMPYFSQFLQSKLSKATIESCLF